MKQLCVTVNFYVVLFLIVNSHLLCFMLCVGQNFDEEYCQPKSIKRRYSGDIVVDTGVGHITCNEDNRTYMVEENRCVKNENLYSECRFFALTPRQEPMVQRLSLFFKENKRAMTFDSGVKIANASIISTSNRAHTDGSLCQIDSLQVCRGKKQATEISHNGFFLSVKGAFEINTSQLAHNFEEYKGELFRMNLSCFGGGLPSNGCLFFKMIGIANITKPKFNCALPGSCTLYNYAAECKTSLHHNSSQWTTSPRPFPTTSIGIENISSSGSHFDIGSLLYVFIAVGGGIASTVIFCLLCCVCTTLFCRRKRMRVSALSSTEMERRISTVSKQMDTENDIDLHIYETPNAVVCSDVLGCNYLENNPLYHRSVNMSCKGEDILLECSYAEIPNNSNSEPVYQPIKPQSRRTGSRSGVESIITAQNGFYESSLNVKPQWNDYDTPDL